MKAKIYMNGCMQRTNLHLGAEYQKKSSTQKPLCSMHFVKQNFCCIFKYSPNLTPPPHGSCISNINQPKAKEVFVDGEVTEVTVILVRAILAVVPAHDHTKSLHNVQI